MKAPAISVLPRLRVMKGKTIALGPGKIELLELLEKHGSITRAAREMKMSYMRAWSLIQTMNRSFKEPLVVSHPGGLKGGGAALTPNGRKVLAWYQQMDVRCQRAILPAQKRLAQWLA